MRPSPILIAALFVFSTSARVVWIPEQFDPSDKINTLAASLTPRANNDLHTTCGSFFPADFTCPTSTQCLALNSSASVKSVLCCPAGQDCRVVQPNATLYQGSSLYSEPTVQLDTCAGGCCPMGYSCQLGQCAAASAPVPAAAIVGTPASSVASSTTPGAIVPPTTSASSSSSPTATDAAGLVAGVGSGSHSKFSGSSFAIGLITGIFLGAIMAGLVFWLLARRARSRESYVNEKQSPRDTLTDLATLSRRPTLHGRSISEPITHPDAGGRTDFLRTTPPRVPDGTGVNMGYSVEVHASGTAPQTPARTPKAVKALFSRSPFMTQTPASPASTQPPLPAHLKRGTLSFAVSPVRALKKQKSMHSLRRQMTDTSRSSNWRTRPDGSRSGSQETIQVLMPSHEPYTPDQRPRPHPEAPATLESTVYQPHDSATSWRTTDSPQAAMPKPAPAQYASSSRYPTETFTPTRLRAHNANINGGNNTSLGTPYMPIRYYAGGNGPVKDVLLTSDGGLRVVREPEKRDTTFSAMMERAGFRKSELDLGTQSRRPDYAVHNPRTR
ncbi:hypothetical protein LTS02_005565 [Friedmanniomyces endolithicus]|nr:hypothetical protein LTS02_005565 [Friedmanniomyces endolithicus]KAK0866022.1 hypothetical protein LTR87_015172 [Friedmanniomyces endolithicus]